MRTWYLGSVDVDGHAAGSHVGRCEGDLTHVTAARGDHYRQRVMAMQHVDTHLVTVNPRRVHCNRGTHSVSSN